MRYPVPSGEDDTPDEKKIPTTPKVDSPQPRFDWDLAADGQITARMYVLGASLLPLKSHCH